MKIKHLIVPVAIALIITSCGGSKESETQVAQDTIMADTTAVDTLATKVDEMKDFLFHSVIVSFLSPTKLVNEIRASKLKYDDRLIIPLNHKDIYTTYSQYAMAYGAYSVNLCYLSAYDQSDKVPVYVKMLKDLAEKLGASESMNKITGRNFDKIISNHDSLMAVLDRLYDGMEHYLENNLRLETASFTLVGMWIEANYLTLKLIEGKEKTNENALLYKKTWEEKVHLANIIKLLELYDQTQELTSLLGDLKGHKATYDMIKNEDDFNKVKIAKLTADITVIRAKFL